MGPRTACLRYTAWLPSAGKGTEMPVSRPLEPRLVSPGPLKNALKGSVRAPSEKVTSAWASSTRSGARVSPEGEARQMLPPMVAVFRIWSEANWCAADHRSGSRSRTSWLSSSSWIVASGPMWTPPLLSRMAFRSGMRLMFTRQPGSSWYLMSTITSVPPAMTSACSPYRSSSESASLTVLGSK